MVTKFCDIGGANLQREMHLYKIRNRILEANTGTIFVPSDFKDIASRETVKMALSRLCEEQTIRRIMRGVYEYPEYNNLIQEFVSPSPDRVAQALARNLGWNIVPCGDTALNLLGLSTQVPNVWSYVSNGANKIYKIDNVVLKFKHTANKEITGISYKTALVIQALKALGNNNINEKIITKLSISLSDEEKKILFIEAKYTTAWIYETIKKVRKIQCSNSQSCHTKTEKPYFVIPQRNVE